MEKSNQALPDDQLFSAVSSLNKESLQAIVKQRASKQKGISMQYFWASMVMQIIVYGFLSNVIIRYWEDTSLRSICLFCMLLYLPFSLVLLRDFKKIARLRTGGDQGTGQAVSDYIQEQHRLLLRHYQFKKRYELLVIAISLGIMTWVILRIYAPGGLMAHTVLAAAIFIPSMLACVLVSRKDDRKHFQEPLRHLESIIADLKS